MLEANVQERVNTWLNGNYDADTKAEIQRLLDKK